MRIRNWKKFQHYKYRGPPWIKLHRGLLNDRFWHALDDECARALVNLWLIASEADGELPEIADLAFRLRIPEKQLNSIISKLSNWLEQGASTPLADCLHVATPERERETERETEREKRKTGKILLPDSWKPSASHFDLAEKRGLSADQVDEAADEMRSWSLGNGERRTNWDWVFNNWLRRNADRKKHGYGGSRTLQDDRLSVSKAADRLISAQIVIPARPRLVSDESEDHQRLISTGRSS